MVIVSENAKSPGKAKSTQNTKNQSVASKIKVIKPLIVISSLFLSPYVFAGNIVQSPACPNNTMPGIQLTYRVGGSNASAQFAGGSFPSSAIADFADNAVSIGSDCSNLNWALSNAVAIGGAAASVSGVAIGTGALAYDEYNVAMGSQAKARGKNSVALGANSVTDRANTFAVGSATNLRQITSVAVGTENTDAVNKLQMDESVGVVNNRVTTEVGTLNTRIGTEVGTLNTRLTSEVGTLDGKITTNSTAITVLDGRVSTNETDIANLKSGQGSLNQLAVQYDTATQDTITLKGASDTTLTNLKAGDISNANSKDAVTGGQLFNTNQNVTNLDHRVTTEVGTLNTRIGNEVSTLDGKITTNSNAITGLDSRVTTEVGTLNTRIGTEVGMLNTRLTSEVGTLDGKITTNSNAINTLGGRVTTNETDIANLQQGQGCLNQLAVQYDTATQDTITLKGASDTTLTNLKAGDISNANSKDAVTGGQLFSTNQNVTNLDHRVTTEVGTLNTRIGNEVGTLDGKITTNSNAITGLDSRVTTEVGTLNTRIGTEVGTLNTRLTSEVGTLDGKITTNSNAINTLGGRVTTNETDIANLKSGQGSLNQLAVQYDTATQDTITLKGASDTTLTNLKAGDISNANSKDAVTGGQLFSTNQNVTNLDHRVTTEVGTLNTRIGTEVGTLNTRMTSEVGTLDGKITTNSTAISSLDGRVTTNETDIANLQQGQGSLNQLAVQYDTATQDTITLKGVNGTTLTNLKAGDISNANSKDAVTGGQLFNTNQNVTNLDHRVTTEVGTLNTRIGSEVSTLDGKITTNSTAITVLDGRVSTNETDIANLQQGQGSLNQLAVQYDSTTQDAITLKGVNGTTLTNLKAGDISNANSKDAVTGGQLFNTNQNVTNLDNRVTTEVGTLNTRIGNEVNVLDGKITTNSNAITGLDGRVSTNETDIANLQQGQGSLNQLAVQYNSATQDTITLKGATGTTLTNLKAGDISNANSKDAVTGGQLFSTNQAVSTLGKQMDQAAQQVVSIVGGGASYNNGQFVLPTFSIQGGSYRNIGDTFSAVNNELTNIKTSVVDLKKYVDQQDIQNLDSANRYTDTQSSGTLANAKSYIDQQDAQNLADAKHYTDQQATQTLNTAQQYTDQQSTTVLQNAHEYTDSKVAGINTGAANTSGTGTNSTAIGPNTVVSGNNSTAVGVGNNVSGNNSGAFGDPNLVTANGSYVIGNDNTVRGDNTFVFGNNVNTAAKNAVVLGHNSAATRDNTVSVGSSGNERQISHVADATEATDAVNLRQMQTANTEILKASKDYTDTRINTLESSFTDFSYQTDRRFKEVDKRFDRQGAMSAAMMNMATSTAGLTGLNRVGVAAGFQGGEKAVAIGYQRIVSENVSLSVGGAFTDEEGSGGAGVGFSW